MQYVGFGQKALRDVRLSWFLEVMSSYQNRFTGIVFRAGTGQIDIEKEP
jgi:hypothetical protein